MADGRHIENRFLAISRRHIGRLMRNLDGRWRITCRYVTWPKRQFLTNYRWQTAAILKIALSPYLSRELNLLTTSLTTFLFCAAADFTHLLCSVLQISTKHVLLKYTDSRTFKYLCCFQDFPCLANYSCLPCLAKIQGLSRTCGHPVL